jgi:HEAT repeat protein
MGLAGHQEEAPDGLIAAGLQDPDHVVKATAISICRNSKIPLDSDYLLSLLAHPSAELLTAVIRALATDESEGVEAALIAMLGHREEEVREEAFAALVGRAHPGILPALVRAFQRQNRPEDTSLEEALAKHYEAMKGLVDRLFHDRDERLRAMAVGVYHASGDLARPEIALRALKDSHPRVTLRTARLLSGESAVEVIPLLNALLLDSSPDVRANALAALACLGDETAKPRLKALSKLKDERVARPASRALATLRQFSCGIRP